MCNCTSRTICRALQTALVKRHLRKVYALFCLVFPSVCVLSGHDFTGLTHKTLLNVNDARSRGQGRYGIRGN